MRTFAVDAEIMPMKGVNDPQGDAVLAGLKLLGFETASPVRVGKLVRFSVDAETESDVEKVATEMCQKLLANPVIEEFELNIKEV